MDLTEKTLSQEYKYKGRIVNIRLDKISLADKNTSYREVCEHPGGVCVIPIDQNGDIYLVRQYRYPFLEETLEIPAGKLNYGEEHYSCGLRELKEETGLIAGNYEYLGVIYPSPGFLNEKIHIYLATNLKEEQSCPDEDEFLLVEKLPQKKLLEKITKNEIKDAKTIIAYFLATEKINKRAGE